MLLLRFEMERHLTDLDVTSHKISAVGHFVAFSALKTHVLKGTDVHDPKATNIKGLCGCIETTSLPKHVSSKAP